ncbi:MAG: nuclear transport factor 2 family protein [Gammaproteobacteria bacterium]|nr:nuclear transport factor 2 family protein [Gammaproteobacteria bacterium]MBU1979435.1 nuclear transport factor 2 family protein [Gammaproteobacteria bacterium]
MSIVEEAMRRFGAAQQNDSQPKSEMPAPPPSPEKPVWHKLLVAGVVGFVLGAGTASTLLTPVSSPIASTRQEQEITKPVQPAYIASNPNTEEDSRQPVKRFVDSWVKAWSEQNLNNYLSAYAPEFEPPGGLTRSDWEKQRRKRLGKYHKIEINLSDLTTLSKGDTAVVEFVQSFNADGFSETGLHKRLELRLQGERWLIMKEISRKE